MLFDRPIRKTNQADFGAKERIERRQLRPLAGVEYVIADAHRSANRSDIR